MNSASNAVPESPPDPQGAAPAPTRSMSQTRPMYWSVRRELWENRSIYIAPLIAAAVVLVGFLISVGKLPDRMLLHLGVLKFAQAILKFLEVVDERSVRGWIVQGSEDFQRVAQFLASLA